MKEPVILDQSLFDSVIQKASASPRRRMNFNFHQHEDAANRMLNVIEPDSYLCPHRHLHPPLDEAFLVLQGQGVAFIFDSDGQIIHMNLLDPFQQKWGIDIPGGWYHTILSLKPASVFYEVKAGPYDPSIKKDFAPWAPEEHSSDASQYLEELKKIAYSEFNLNS